MICNIPILICFGKRKIVIIICNFHFLPMSSSSPVGTFKLLYAKSVRTVSCSSTLSIRLLALPTQMDKQQPLTLARYIVLPFRIVYIRSVSVVATRPLCVFKFCENLIVKASFNNALLQFCLTTLRRSAPKLAKKTLCFAYKNKKYLSVFVK